MPCRPSQITWGVFPPFSGTYVCFKKTQINTTQTDYSNCAYLLACLQPGCRTQRKHLSDSH